MKGRKAEGIDNVSEKEIKAEGEKLMKCIQLLFNKFLKWGNF